MGCYSTDSQSTPLSSDCRFGYQYARITRHPEGGRRDADLSFLILSRPPLLFGAYTANVGCAAIRWLAAKLPQFGSFVTCHRIAELPAALTKRPRIAVAYGIELAMAATWDKRDSERADGEEQLGSDETENLEALAAATARAKAIVRRLIQIAAALDPVLLQHGPRRQELHHFNRPSHRRSVALEGLRKTSALVAELVAPSGLSHPFNPAPPAAVPASVTPGRAIFVLENSRLPPNFARPAGAIPALPPGPPPVTLSNPGTPPRSLSWPLRRGRSAEGAAGRRSIRSGPWRTSAPGSRTWW